MEGKGRSCESGLFCCIDPDGGKLPSSTCVNKANNERCGVNGLCYDGDCHTEGSYGETAELDETCGYGRTGTCKEVKTGIYENGCTTISSDLEYNPGEVQCKTDANELPFPLICCTQEGAVIIPPPNPIDIHDFDPTYQACAGTQPREGIVGGMGMFSGSIVPCGRSCDDLGTPNTNEMKECTICHFILMGKRIYDLVLSLLIVVSIVMLTASGILYMFSGANPSLNSTAKEIVKKTLIGFALFLGSWLIVSTILILISANNTFLGTGSSWYNFSCDTTSKFQMKDSQGNQSWQNPNNLNIPVD
jgi:hypothetical protein